MGFMGGLLPDPSGGRQTELYSVKLAKWLFWIFLVAAGR